MVVEIETRREREREREKERGRGGREGKGELLQFSFKLVEIESACLHITSCKAIRLSVCLWIECDLT